MGTGSHAPSWGLRASHNSRTACLKARSRLGSVAGDTLTPLLGTAYSLPPVARHTQTCRAVPRQCPPQLRCPLTLACTASAQWWGYGQGLRSSASSRLGVYTSPRLQMTNDEGLMFLSRWCSPIDFTVVIPSLDREKRKRP